MKLLSTRLDRRGEGTLLTVTCRWLALARRVCGAFSVAPWVLAVGLMALAPTRSAHGQCEPVGVVPGVEGIVHAMVNWDPDGVGPLPPVVVVGGNFDTAGGVEVYNIASWNPATGQWSALGSGMSGLAELTEVNALAVLPNGNLVAGGDFLTAGGVSASYIARWNGTAWSPIGSAVDERVRALAVMPNGDLVAGGDFWYVARWDGAAWSAIDNASNDGEVYALAVMPNGDLVAGGRFLHFPGVPANKIARWDGTVWSAMGAGMNDLVTALAVLPSGDLVAGGSFTTADGQDAFFTARWNGTAWSPLGGLSSNVLALALLPSGDVVAGGNFVVAGSVSALRIARWDGTAWSAYGSGMNDAVYSLAVLPGGDVVAGGTFDSAGGLTSNAIARWNGTSWSDLISAITASDAAAGDEFGISVAISGDTAVVGARRDDNAAGGDAGSAYVYVKSGPPGSEVWTEQAKLIGTTSDGLVAGSESGISVAISGDTALVGSWLWPSGNATGMLFVFVRSGPPGGEVWTQQAALQCPQFGSFEYFGYALSLEGDTAVVGSLAAPGLNVGGQVFFYARSGPPGGEFWTAGQKFPSDGVPGDQFGNSVAMSPSQDTAIVGAWLDDNDGGTDAGSAYIFSRTVSPPNGWLEQAKLTASDGAADDRFGVKVAISGDTAVVGAYQDDHAGGTNAGSVYIFTRSGTVWTEQAKLTASDAAAGDGFGVSLALSGDTVVVGAYGDDHASGSDAGSAYVFTRSGPPGSEVWTEQFKLVSPDPAADDWFGVAVALDGDRPVIGARQDDHAGGINAGSVYIFDLGCATAACCPGDFDASGAVTDTDISGLVAAMLDGTVCLGPPACCPGDFNSDGFVNGSDVSGFVANLLAGGACP